MRQILLTLAIALMAGLPSARADIGVSATVRSGESFLTIRNGTVRGRLQIGDGPAVRERQTRRERRRLRRERRQERRQDRRRVIIVPERSFTTRRTEPAPPPAPPVDVKTDTGAVSKVPPRPAPPPDPAGNARIIRARGVAARGAGLSVGRPVPLGVPHVTLDHRRYDLPPPPPGQIYARVRASVVLIDPVTRMVHALDVE